MLVMKRMTNVKRSKEWGKVEYGTNVRKLQIETDCSQEVENVVKGSGKVRNGCKRVSRGKVLRLHTVFGVLTQSEDLVSSLHSIYSSTSG